MPRSPILPLSPELLAGLDAGDRRRFALAYRSACRVAARLDDAPRRCRRRVCRESGTCHLEYRKEWTVFCPGWEGPDLDLFGTFLFGLVTSFIGEMSAASGKSDEDTPDQITLSSRNGRPSATRS